jgi:hypothetical protein
LATVTQSELDALIPATRDYGYPLDWVERIPPGTLCYINALAGEVWMQGFGRRWLADALEDAEEATQWEYR